MEHKNSLLFTNFEVSEEHHEDIYTVFVEKSLKEKLPKLFVEVSPFKPNKPGPKAKLVDKTIIQNKFGSIILTGRELMIFDENILLALLSTKKQIIAGDYYFVTSLRELAKLTGTTWRGAKIDKTTKEIKGNSTPKQILQSLIRLWETGIVINNKNTERSYRFRIVESVDTPMVNEKSDIIFNKGEKEQVKVKISKEFFYLYSVYNNYTIKLQDRIIIKDLIGQAIYRYLRYLTTFQKKGIHKERLKILITKINWDLPQRTKNDTIYIRWDEVKRQLNNASIGLQKIGISLSFTEKLDEDSIITIKKTTEPLL